MQISAHRPLPIISILLIGCHSHPVSSGADTTAHAPPAEVPAVTMTAQDSVRLSGLSVAMPGVWQEIPEYASGWTDAYQFFPDGRYAFHSSEMDCATRLQSEFGTWRVEGGNLVLTTDERVTREGGHYEEAMGSCGTDSSLEGSTPRTTRLRPPRTMTFPYHPPALVRGEIHNLDLKGPGMIPAAAIGLRIDTTTWYKMREDPADYP